MQKDIVLPALSNDVYHLDWDGVIPFQDFDSIWMQIVAPCLLVGIFFPSASGERIGFFIAAL